MCLSQRNKLQGDNIQFGPKVIFHCEHKRLNVRTFQLNKRIINTHPNKWSLLIVVVIAAAAVVFLFCLLYAKRFNAICFVFQYPATVASLPLNYRLYFQLDWAEALCLTCPSLYLLWDRISLSDIRLIYIGIKSNSSRCFHHERHKYVVLKVNNPLVIAFRTTFFPPFVPTLLMISLIVTAN